MNPDDPDKGFSLECRLDTVEPQRGRVGMRDVFFKTPRLEKGATSEYSKMAHVPESICARNAKAKFIELWPCHLAS